MIRTAIVVSLLFATGAAAQEPTIKSAAGPEADVAAVREVVVGVFDAMRAADTTSLASWFHPEARLISTSRQQGRPVAGVEEVSAFTNAVGAPHDKVYDERVWDLEIRVDGDLAVAWMPYAFYLGDQFSHCGVDLFQLVRTADGWRIIELADTRRREGCSPPS